MTRINSPRGIFLTTMTCRRPLYFFLLLSRAGLVFFQAQPQCCYHCNAFTISHALRSERTQKYQFAANDVVVAGGSRLFSTYDDGVGHCLSSPPDIDEGDSHNHHHLHQQQNSRNRREFIFQSIATASSIASLFPYLAFADDDYITPTSSSSSSSSSSTIIIDPAFQMPTITQTIYLDIKFENYVEPKRLVIGLFGKDLPRTVENFVMLCTNKNNNNAGGMESGNGASYVGSTIYRVLSENSIQGGAIGSPNNDGSSGKSAYDDGKPFLPDNYNIRHTLPGLVSAVRANSEGYIDSRFFVQTESDAGWADGRYAAFGIVLDEEKKKSGGGMDLVRRISKVNVKRPRNSPKESVTIVGCGLL